MLGAVQWMLPVLARSSEKREHHMAFRGPSWPGFTFEARAEVFNRKESQC